MKVLVTGGSGFLGSHVADSLTENGHEVTIFDRSPSPYISGNQQMIVGDILDTQLLKEILPGFDVVYHFAGIADIDECLKRPVDVVKINIEATVQILEILRHQPLKRFVYASTAYVYSDSGGFYRASKQASESFLHLYNKLYNLPYTILRFGSLYGTRSDDKNAIHRFVRQALLEKKITYSGTGEEVRQFIHVKDASQASVNILGDEFANQEILLTGPDSLHYKELFQMITEIVGGNIQVNFSNYSGGSHYFITPYNFTPRLGKKYLLNPFTDMGQGILELIQQIYNKEIAGKE